MNRVLNRWYSAVSVDEKREYHHEDLLLYWVAYEVPEIPSGPLSLVLDRNITKWLLGLIHASQHIHPGPRLYPVAEHFLSDPRLPEIYMSPPWALRNAYSSVSIAIDVIWAECQVYQTTLGCVVPSSDDSIESHWSVHYGSESKVLGIESPSFAIKILWLQTRYILHVHPANEWRWVLFMNFNWWALELVRHSYMRSDEVMDICTRFLQASPWALFIRHMEKNLKQWFPVAKGRMHVS